MTPDRDARTWRVVLALAVIAGAALRLWQLDAQILIDDEWHTVHKLLRAPVSDIVMRLGFADYSIPLTLYYRWLADHAWLSERSMHAPLALAGLALLALGPSLARGWTDPRTRALWTALLALSPLLVYHSRIARPYALTVLLAFAAIVAFRAWWQTRQARYAWIYVPATFLAGWLHPVTLPFTLTPFLHYGVPALRDVLGRRASWRDSRVGPLFVVGLVTAALLALALLPPMINDWTQFGAKAGRDSVTPQSIYRTLLMVLGTKRGAVGVALFALALTGGWRLARRDRDLARYLALVLVLGGIAVTLTRAQWIMHPLVLARYLLPGLPFLLLLVAEGFGALLDRAPPVLQSPPRQALAAAIVCAGLVASGPLPSVLWWPNQFWGHLRFQFDYDPRHNPYVTQVPATPIPAFYRALAQRPPGSVTLIEAPWRLESNFDPHPWYQQVHRQWVKIGLVTPVCGERDFGEYPETTSGLRMRWLVHLSAVLRGETFGADYLVMHLTPWKTPPDAGVEWPDVERCLPQIEAKLGAPVHRDEAMVVFALNGARSAAR